jgi:hypothetical protein
MQSEGSIAEQHEPDSASAQLVEGGEVIRPKPRSRVLLEEGPDRPSIDGHAPPLSQCEVGSRGAYQPRDGAEFWLHEAPFDPVYDLHMYVGPAGELDLRKAGPAAGLADGTGGVHAHWIHHPGDIVVARVTPPA